MISVQNLKKTFGPTVAVADLSFRIDTGEVVGLLGPNGAGKTTTMRILAGLLEPDAGRVTIGEYSPYDNPKKAKKLIGYLPENNALEEELLVSEYLAFVTEIRRLADAKDRIREAVQKTGIAQVFYRPIGELSKGYRQRVGLAATILADPKVLILDEPTEGLDPNQRTEIRTLIQGLAKNHTIIVSTHVLREIERIANRIIIIHAGKMVADGSLETLSRSVSSEASVSCQIDGENVAEGLRALENVKNVREERDAHGQARYFVSASGEARELAERIFALAKDRGWTLTELHQERSGIEEIFRELTK